MSSSTRLFHHLPARLTVPVVAWLLVAGSAPALAQNVQVNPGAGSYPTLAAAFAAINSGVHTGAV
jgi:hypothetical protein